MGLRITAVLFVLAWAAVSAEAMPADQPDEEVFEIDPIVISATLAEQRLSQAPSSIEVITQRQIQEMGATTVAQALEEAVGLILTTESGRVVRPSIRGTDMDHTLLLVDGRRLAPGFRNMSDINQIPTLMIDRIEVVRGPTSALFGSDALGGVINIITRKPPTETMAAGVDLRAGSNTHAGGDTVLPQAYGSASIKPVRFIIGSQYKKVNGWDYDGAPPDDGDDLEQEYVSGQASVDIIKDHTLSFGGYYNRFDRNGLRYLENTTKERAARDDTSDVFLRYDGRFAEDYDLMLQSYNGEYQNEVDVTPSTGDTSVEKNQLNQLEGRFAARFSDSAIMTMGGEYRQDSTKVSGNPSQKYETDNTAGFGQIDLTFFQKFNLVAGLRLDDHSDFGSEWSPRVIGSCRLTKQLRVKAGYGHGFRAPVPYELYETSYRRQAKDIYLPNEDLQPEVADSYEIGLQSSFPVLRGLYMEATYFHEEIEDMIESVLQSVSGKGKSETRTYKYQNISQGESQGIEFLGNLRIPYGLKIGAGLTFLKTENEDTGYQLTGQPDFKGNLNAAWHSLKWGLRARIGYTWYSGAEDGQGGPLDDHSTLDAYLAKELGRGLAVYCGMKNILHDDDWPVFAYTGLHWEY